jgi:hypothetical protein
MNRPSVNFEYSEFFRASSGTILDYDYVKVQRLCENILQPLRDHFNLPIRINSSKRSLTHNKEIGGSPTSDHLFLGRACAADISFYNLAINEEAFNWIIENCSGKFGQLIGYRTGHVMSFMHVSLPTPKHDGSSKDANRILTTVYGSKKYDQYLL